MKIHKTIKEFSKKHKHRVIKHSKHLGLIFLLIPLIVVIFSWKYFNEFKSVYNYTMSGKNNLSSALTSIENKEIEKAGPFISNAQNDFTRAIQILKEIKNSMLISRINYFDDQFNDVENILNTALLVSNAGETSVNLLTEMKDLISVNLDANIDRLPIEDRKNLINKLSQSGSEIKKVKTDLDNALSKLNSVKYNGILWPVKSEVNRYQEKLEQGSEILNYSIPISAVLPEITGYPKESKFLILIQNSDRLRPTGGLMGTYGVLDTKDGDIVKFKMYDTYYLDNLAKDKLKITPPEPFEKYVGLKNFSLLNANWSPDWPKTAQYIETLYKTELKTAIESKTGLQAIRDGKIEDCTTSDCSFSFNGIIGLTPQMFTDLLAVVGPMEVEINGKKTTFTEDNFVTTTEQSLDDNYPKESFIKNKKEVMNQLKDVAKNRLFNFSFKTWPNLLSVMADNISEKNILIYLKDPKLQQILSNYAWSGIINQTPDDYLMVVDANLKASRVDFDLIRSIKYSLEERYDGLYAKVNLEYSYLKDDIAASLYTNPDFYKSYTRIYVPKGSQFLKASGFNSEIKQGEEENKTFFGGLISFKAGIINRTSLEYKLPENLFRKIQTEEYKLLIQKQPGNDVDNLTVNINRQWAFNNYSQDHLYVKQLSDKEVRWETDLLKDREFWIKN